MIKRRIQDMLLATFAGAAGVIAALLTTGQSVRAGANAYIYTGYGTMCEDSAPPYNWNPYGSPVTQGHPCWHFDESAYPLFGALDLDKGLGAGDKNQPVWWIQGATTSSGVVAIRFEAVTGTTCTGVRAVLTGGSAGAFHYKHINPAGGVIGSAWQNWTYWPNWVQGDRYLGTTAETQDGMCPFGGPHLHQSGDVAWYTDIYRNQPTASVCTTSPKRYCWSSQAFQVVW